MRGPAVRQAVVWKENVMAEKPNSETATEPVAPVTLDVPPVPPAGGPPPPPSTVVGGGGEPADSVSPPVKFVRRLLKAIGL